MTVTAVYAAVIGGGREEALDAGDELDGGAKLESHHCGEVGLGEPGQAGAVYQVIGEDLRNKTISGLSQKHSELGCHLGIVLTVVNFRDELCHLLHRPVCQISRSRAWRPLPLRPRLLTLHTGLSLQFLVCQIQRIFLWSLEPLDVVTADGGADTGFGITGHGGEERVEEREAGEGEGCREGRAVSC